MKIRLQHFSGFLVLATVGWAMFHIHHAKQTRQIHCHTVDLRLGPTEFGPPDIWDPPPFIKIFPNGRRKFIDTEFGPQELPPKMEDWLMLYPADNRGISLSVDPETPLQAVVDFLDQFNSVSDLVQLESQKRWGIPGKPARPRIYYFSDTFKPYVFKDPPPPVARHSRPPA